MVKVIPLFFYLFCYFYEVMIQENVCSPTNEKNITWDFVFKRSVKLYITCIQILRILLFSHKHYYYYNATIRDVELLFLGVCQSK